MLCTYACMRAHTAFPGWSSQLSYPHKLSSIHTGNIPLTSMAKAAPFTHPQHPKPLPLLCSLRVPSPQEPIDHVSPRLLIKAPCLTPPAKPGCFGSVYTRLLSPPTSTAAQGSTETPGIWSATSFGYQTWVSPGNPWGL